MALESPSQRELFRHSDLCIRQQESVSQTIQAPLISRHTARQNDEASKAAAPRNCHEKRTQSRIPGQLLQTHLDSRQYTQDSKTVLRMSQWLKPAASSSPIAGTPRLYLDVPLALPLRCRPPVLTYAFSNADITCYSSALATAAILRQCRGDCHDCLCLHHRPSG